MKCAAGLAKVNNSKWPYKHEKNALSTRFYAFFCLFLERIKLKTRKYSLNLHICI